MSDDPRLGDLIVPGSGGHCTLVGFARDDGVRRNGGRPGAAAGPAAFRRLMARVGTLVNPEFGLDLRCLKVFDAGDITEFQDEAAASEADSDLSHPECQSTYQFHSPAPAAQPDDVRSLEAAHRRLHRRVLKALLQGAVPFVVGGGNDQSYPNACALLDYLAEQQVLYQNQKKQQAQGQLPPSRIGVINIDAHLDVRPYKNGMVHSGSPFRELLNNPTFNAMRDSNGKVPFVEFAAQGSQCSQEHVQFIKDMGGSIMWLGELKNEHRSDVVKRFRACLESMGDDCKVFVSFDLDAVQSADAPGVSCASPLGLSALEALTICFEAGRHHNVALVDVSEFNPQIEDYRTGKLVAFMFYHFLLGLAHRETTPGYRKL